MSGLTRTSVSATTAAVTNRFVTSTNMVNSTYTIANASPVWAGGCFVTITHTTVAVGTDTLGTITIAGTDLFGQTISEVITPVADSTATGKKVFRSVTSATGAGWAIAGGNDTIVIGCAAGQVVCPGGGQLYAVELNNTVAAAVTISDAVGTIATIPASQAAGTFYLYQLPVSGWLKISTTSTNDLVTIHSTGVPSVYAMS